MSALPRITVAFLSWNRLHYFRAALESARRCIRYPDIEWIISDNESREPGLREYIESLDWVPNKWFREQTHAAAMNEIVARATGRYLVLWPDDVQFVVEGDWMVRLIETLESHPWIGSAGLNFLRRKTYRRLVGPPRSDEVVSIAAEAVRRKLAFRIPRRISGPQGLVTCGWRLPGVVASGIPSLTPLACWKALGPWRTRDATQSNIVDSSLGAEDDMIARFQNGGFNWQQALMMTPVAADIINDETGCKAKIRQGKRHGVYTPPVDGPFYYEILQQPALPGSEGVYPHAFEDTVRPIGFQLPRDHRGNLLKSSLNSSVISEIA
jgi:Glycosyl transferase family 2